MPSHRGSTLLSCASMITWKRSALLIDFLHYCHSAPLETLHGIKTCWNVFVTLVGKFTCGILFRLSSDGDHAISSDQDEMPHSPSLRLPTCLWDAEHTDGHCNESAPRSCKTLNGICGETTSSACAICSAKQSGALRRPINNQATQHPSCLVWKKLCLSVELARACPCRFISPTASLLAAPDMQAVRSQVFSWSCA